MPAAPAAIPMPDPVAQNEVILVSSGDLRLSAK